MEQIYTDYHPRGLEIYAFPCNQFANQEPGTNAEIKAWAIENYNVTFPMMSKIDVNGPNAIPLFQWLRSESSLEGRAISWNFGKFVLNANGDIVRYWPPEVNPNGTLPVILDLLGLPTEEELLIEELLSIEGDN